MPYKSKERRNERARERYAADPTIQERAKERRREGYSTDYYHRKRNKLIEQFGGKCVVCGATEELEFDHIDKRTKVAKISHLLASSSWQSVIDEAQKCQLLCKECHIKKTTECRDNVP
jgi:5-methylcytosine-specific restriction endonuclease McrA